MKLYISTTDWKKVAKVCVDDVERLSIENAKLLGAQDALKDTVDRQSLKYGKMADQRTAIAAERDLFRENLAVVMEFLHHMLDRSSLDMISDRAAHFELSEVDAIRTLLSEERVKTKWFEEVKEA